MPSVGRILLNLATVAAPLLVGGAVLAWSVDLRPSSAPPPPGPSRVRPVPAHPPPGVVIVRRREGDPFVRAPDPDGGPGTVAIACATCHSTRPSNARTRSAADLDTFHQGLKVAHGDLACVACHAPPAYDALRRADGERVAYADAMRLCGQCHGPQRRDYDQGAHGGMNGYWDLARGGRTRVDCLHCHDPHAPRFPVLVPARGPNDRFLAPAHASHDEPKEGRR
jgi:hypothetical protein